MLVAIERSFLGLDLEEAIKRCDLNGSLGVQRANFLDIKTSRGVYHP